MNEKFTLGSSTNVMSSLIHACLYFLPFLFIWQGIDVIDTGYAVVQGKELIYSPSSAHIYGLPLTLFFNGAWLYFTDALGLGLLGARMGSIPIYWGIFYLSSRILKRVMPELETDLFILLTFLLTFKVNWIYYSFLTVLFALWSALYIVKYEENGRTVFLFFAGFISGLNVFVRLPNLLFISFSIIPIIATISGEKRSKIKKAFLELLTFCFGWGAAILSVLLLLHLGGFLDWFVKEVAETFVGSKSSESSHGFYSLMRMMIFQYIDILSYTSLLFIGFLLISYLFDKFPKSKPLLFFGTAVIGLILGGRWIVFFPIFGLCYAVLLCASVWAMCNKNRLVIVISLLGAAMLLITPIGSNSGALKTRDAMWIGLPLSVFFLGKLGDMDISLKSSTIIMKLKISVVFIRKILICGLVMLALTGTYREVYWESSSRLSMIYPMKHPKLWGIYTTKDRADVIDKITEEIEKYVKPRDTVFVFPDFPLLHYLTDTRPYVGGNSFAAALLIPEVFEQYLNKARAESKALPVIVKTKYSLGGGEWPQKKSPSGYEKFLPIFSKFIDDNNYKKVWEDETFEILTTEQ